MVAAVFLLAAGSFIYFKLYTGLERDRKQYSLLVRLGMTEKELRKIVNRQLVPQFFLPWGVALLHSTFAFISLQVVWDEFAELSILGEMVLVLSGFTVAQILYFFFNTLALYCPSASIVILRCLLYCLKIYFIMNTV
nr:FtsX-like permease family protein [Planococcus glaciei]